VGPVRACSGHFHEMAILELLLLRKFSTTLLKVAPTCKISKLDFLNGQTKAILGVKVGQQHLGGYFSHFGQHELCSTNYPKCN
jgi:hypothetical protein